MWDRWKKKLSNLFFEKTEENDDESAPVEWDYGKRELRTRMTYQYPARKPFRFPVIPDTPSQEPDDSDKPAFARKQTENQAKTDEEQPEEVDLKDRQIYRPDPDKPFTPSDVPSPIYGFQHREKREERRTEIPAFQRKQEEQSEPVREQEQSTEPVLYTTLTANENESTDDPEGNSQPDAIVEEHTKADAAEEPRNERREEKNQYPRKRQVQQNGSNSGKPLPFNVMMSANDKLKQKQTVKTRKPEPVSSTMKHKSVETNTIPYYLLDDPEPKSTQDALWMNSEKELLEKTLEHFHVRAKVVRTTQGPSVTRFEVQPEPGVKVSKIKNLSDDLKLNMAAKDIRMEAPIPGKSTIGIEIPNQHAQKVGLQEIFSSERFQSSTSPLTVGLGLNIEGEPQITDIQKMPHGLIAGATGSGKSVCINAILISLLYKANHEDVKFLMIDPKMVELAPFNGIPHLLSPVITDVKAATAALKWAVSEMEERYDAFVREGVRDIKRFNKKMEREYRHKDKMPFIVIVIDELADLMMAAPQDVEDAISRIAQKARACGIHLLLATQRPSVDVITGLIKANIPTRIAFSVSSQVDSRTILDVSGAEKLLGYGDMLFTENGSGKSVRIQGAFVSDDEIDRVADYARSIAEPEYQFEQEQLLAQVTKDDETDELLDEAIDFVVQHNRASTSLLQRQFKIGYNRAARLMDAMENEGIIAQQNGSKPREVLVSAAQVRKG
ncbi:DNA translocase FtsK [Lentibacillus cibarius]|uniref:DNA translocase FtsK n=1 Tax=Lentibacillus cibarius TaxID=2583219 RepID=A0A5S3QJ06_9BACI|nr:DNA translocase FtsK [Lentibacillus cibarius]TMN21201.1 DNA translocase FtsK [Lentibacillus cibarius]